jgi:ADP-ribose pyrophosphatase
MRETGSHLHWVEQSRRIAARSPLFDLAVARRTSPSGKSGDFWILQAPDWVNVVPVLPHPGGGEDLVMVRQYRHGAEMLTLEFPAGLIKPGEDPALSAARELSEETGYRAGRMTLLATVMPNPAFMSNRCFTFLAEELVREGEQHLDELEELDALVVPGSELEERMATGELVNSLTCLAWAFYRRHRAGRP